MACRLVLKADNGKPSILFKSIADTVETADEAIDIYFFTKTDEFKKAYGNYESDEYSGPALDENGEPKYETFSKDKFQYDTMYNNVNLENKAHVLKKLMDEIPAIQQKLKDKIKHMQGLGDKSLTLQKLEELDRNLSTGTLNESIPKFLNMANAHVFALRKEFEKALKDPTTDIKKLTGMHRAAQSYTVIEDLKLELLGEDVKKIFEEDLFPIGATLDNIRAIESLYLSKAKDHLVAEFHKRDKTWSPADIRKALDHAPRDLRMHEQLLEYVGDSPDSVISMVGVIMMEAEHKIRRASVDFAKRLQPIVEKLERKYPNQNMYDKLIYEKSNGELHIYDIDAEFTNGVDAEEDAQYKKIQELKSDPDMFEFLVFFTEEYRKMQTILAHAAPVMGTRIPTVLKSDWERTEGNSIKDRASMMVDGVAKSIQRSNLDIEKGLILDSTGRPVKRIPTFYTQKYDSLDYDTLYTEKFDALIKSGVEETAAIETAHAFAEAGATKKTAAFISRDLGHALQSFHAMAMNFGAKNELITTFETAADIVGSKDRLYNRVDSGGRIMRDVNTKRIQTIGGNESVAKKTMESFLDIHLYGQREKDLGYIEVGNFKIDNNAILRTLGGATGLIQMSANVMASIANIGNGEYNSLLEAVAGEFYDVKNLHQASGFYKNNLSGILSDIGARTPNNIVNMLEEHYDILQNYSDNIKTSERTKAKRLFKTSLAFFMSNVGEHFIQIRTGLAMLDATEAFDANGKSLGGVLKLHKVVDGKLVIPNVFIKEKDGSLVPFDELQQNRVSNKIGSVLRHSQGNYSPQKSTEMNQDARLALVIQFRKWMYPGIVKRFGKKNENRLMEKEMVGFYREGGKVMWNMAKDLRQMKLDVMRENWGKLTPAEKANLRRLVLETGLIVSLGAAGALLSHAGEYFEDEYGEDTFSDNLVRGSFYTLLYQVNRLQTELWAYSNPAEAVKLLRTPVATASILENTIGVLEQATFNPFETYEAGWRKGDSKLLTKLGKLTPIYKHLETLHPEGIKEKTRFYQ